MSAIEPDRDQSVCETFDGLAFIVHDDAEDPTAQNAGGHHAIAERVSRPGGHDTAPDIKRAQISSPQAGMTTCRCGARWGGLRTAHCDACHETFTVVAAFDKHRAGLYKGSGRRCIDPAHVGLVDAGRAYRCWGFAGRGEDEAAL